LRGSERNMGISIISYGKNSFELRPTWGTTSPRERIEFVSQGSTVIWKYSCVKMDIYPLIPTSIQSHNGDDATKDRSKCACLIKNIISPALKTTLIDDFQNKK
jgi:hypothetical protein